MPDPASTQRLDLSLAAGSRAAAPRDGAVREVLRLLSPRSLASRNRYRRMNRAGRLQLAVFLGFGVAFGGAVFVFFYRALSYFKNAEEIGPVLAYKLLGMVFVTFFSILLFSNIVTALSSFFLSRELDRIVAAPVSPRRFFCGIL